MQQVLSIFSVNIMVPGAYETAEITTEKILSWQRVRYSCIRFCCREVLLSVMIGIFKTDKNSVHFEMLQVILEKYYPELRKKEYINISVVIST